MIVSVVLYLLAAWQRLPDMPASKAQHACEACGNSIYVAAGGSDGLHVSTMYRYDLRFGVWSQCAPAPERVQSPVMRSVDGRLFFIGGHDSTKGSVGGKYHVCAAYDPAADKWSLRAPMPTAREDMGSVVLGKEIWIFGGLDNRGHKITTDVEVYDTVTDTWTTREQWTNPRALGDFACTDGHVVYLISGTETMEGYPQLFPSRTPQVYEDGAFADLPPMPAGHCYTEVEFLDGCLYVFGGASSSTADSLDRIDRLNTRRRVWLDPLLMPYPANSVAATQHRGRLYVTGGWHKGAFLAYFYVLAESECAGLPEAVYGGGRGTADDPYQIWTAQHLDALGTHPQDWDKHFRLMTDIDLSEYDGQDGRPAFHQIAPDEDPLRNGFQGTPFRGVFDGDGRTIAHLTVAGEGYLGLFGQVARRGRIRDLGLVDANVTGLGDCVGALAGANRGTIRRCDGGGVIRGGRDYLGGLIGWNSGEVTQCHSHGTVAGRGRVVGGLAGANSGEIAQSHAAGIVRGGWIVGGLIGQNWTTAPPPSGSRQALRTGVARNCYSRADVFGEGIVGGLVGDNEQGGAVARSYSIGVVAGEGWVGGLVGRSSNGVTGSFWDVQTSGQAASAGGTGLATPQMRSVHTFLAAGWDLAQETPDGTDGTWWMLDGWDYPKLAYPASYLKPSDGATDVLQLPFLQWASSRAGIEHDVYFGTDEWGVRNATSDDTTVYRARQQVGITSYNPGVLEVDQTYYWRVDEVDAADLGSPWRGRVWKFRTADFAPVATVDDFEAYTNDTRAGRAIFQTWTDGAGFAPDSAPNGTGALVGNIVEPFAGQTIVHSGWQALPLVYDNVRPPWCSLVARTWPTPQDWTSGDADTLTLYFCGQEKNGPDRLFVGVEDMAGRMALASHPDERAVTAAEWHKWHIPLENLRAANVDLSTIRTLYIGLGAPHPAQPGGRGTIHIDDIRLTRRGP